ncbi:hypothetical protein B0F90DRAFT_1035697 [Multifurca ochricompacta]|uniref:Uncharacterized protein n=1 Tax=Multifurca ochricompacta TaxID=376703 RepID=A0AAD4M1R3_9AGAM|nr:hypothetical protein B0F90DRAFT_1035697 [Multifurca ochricompacta]
MSKSIQDRPTISQIEPVYDHVPSPSPSTLLRSTHTEYLTPIANGPTATTAITTSYQSLDHLISPVLPLPPPNLMKATRSARRIVTTPPHPVEAHKPALREDLSWSVKGMYRLLDLITEQGSSGIVHKVVVPQQSLRAFVNTLSPGAYSSITNVNFQVLDNLMFKPIGIYGSKEEIVRFLYKISAVDKKVAQMLLKKQNDSMTKDASPILRTGLYVVRSFASTASEQAYILYWPEDTTWDDQTASPIQRNRVMFMKYLTRLCDQLVCLLSKAHSQAIIWGDDDAKRNDGDDVLSYSRNEDPEQLLRSEAIKIKDQEENIVARPGFMINTTLLTKKSAPPGVHTNPRISSPIPLNGEEVQGFMTAKFRPAKTFLKPFIHDRQSASQIRLLLGDAALCLSETLGDTSLKTMLDLIAQFPEECKAWERKRNEITKRFRKDRARREVKSEERELGTLRSEFIREIEGLSRQRSRSRRFICVDSFEIKREHFYSPDYYLIHGRQESLQEEMIEYHVYLLRFPIEEKQILQLDPSYVPTPVLDEQSSQPWRVSSQTPVNYVHLLKGDQIIVVIVDSEGWALVFVDHLSRIHTVIQQRSCVERLNLGTISQTFIFAFDESKDMLAIYASARMQLHIVSLNAFLGAGLSGLRRLSQWRSRSSHEPIDLLQFYHHRVSIIHLCFVHGSQEILFVDSSARAAVFSLTTPTPQPRYPSSRLEIDYRLLQSKTPPLQLPQGEAGSLL